MVKRSGTSLFSALVVLLMAAVCMSPRGDATESSSQLRPVEDYLWMNYYRLREGRSWIRVSRSRRALYVKFSRKDKDKVSSVRADTLPPSRTEGLFNHVRRIRFFELNDASPPDSIQVQADILTVGARLKQRTHQVSARPPSAVPSGLMGLTDSLESVVSALDRVGEGTLVKGLALSESRAEELRTNGAPQLAFDQVSQYRTLRSAVEHPDQFFLVGRAEASRLPEKVADVRYFLVSTDERSVAIEFYPIKDTG